MTSAAARLETFTAGVETAVDVAQVERQLAALWRLAAESGAGAVTRASQFNLMACAETEAARDQVTQTIRALTSRLPCRAIVLLARPQAGRAELSASIIAHCHLAGGDRKQVCCEQISIAAAGSAVTQLPGAVLPLLESDLPTVLWWQGVFPGQTSLFQRLVRVADRFIFDTSAWPVHALTAAADAIRAQSHCRFADLSWTRLACWRQLTAELFDPPACRAELARLQSVELVHGEGPGARLRAWLYGGWLAAQLGWSATTAADRVRLRARGDAEARAAGLLRVTLRTAAAEFVIEKEPGRQVVSTRTRLPNQCALPRRRALWPTDDVALLAQELDEPARHTVYQPAFVLAVRLAGAPVARHGGD